MKLEVGKLYRTPSGKIVEIIKLIGFSWNDEAIHVDNLNAMFFFGDDANLYTADGKGIPKHEIDRTFDPVEDLAYDAHREPHATKDLATTVAYSTGNVGFHIAELKRILSISGLTPIVTIS